MVAVGEKITFTKLCEQLGDDIRFHNNGAFRMMSLVFNSSLKIILYYRFAHYFRKKSKIWSPCAKFFEWVIRIRYASDINGFAKIGRKVRMPHPYGIVIGGKSIIGDNCFIGQRVTVGGNMGKSQNGISQPMIGDNVMLCAGCVVVGPVEIGGFNVVAVNAVVTKSFKEEHVVLAGVPAKILRTVD